MNLRRSVFAACVLSLAGIAQAGAIFRIEVEDLTAGGQVEITEIKVDGNRMRTDSGGDNASSMIFLGDTDEMYLIDHREKSYIVMDRETVEALANQMSQAMKQMEGALKDVPPEQREMMQRMMKDRTGSMPATTPRGEPQVRSLGDSDTVNGVTCDWKEVTRDAVVEVKACVCDWTDVAGAGDLRRINLEMSDFVSALLESFSSASGSFGFAENPMSTMEDLDGFPLISEDFDNGTLARRSRFQSVEEAAISDEEFSPPSGYRKKDLGNMSR